MLSDRPVYLNLLAIRLPVPALVSIVHRISGILLFISLPAAIGLLEKLVRSEQDFLEVMQWLQTPWIKVLVWLNVMALFYHTIAGVRHLLLDMEIGISLAGGRIGAYWVLSITAIFGLILGIGLW